MTNPAEPGPPIDQSAVTAARFTLTPLGRRGYQPDEVDEYLAHVAAELSQRDSREESLRAEADRYREALRDWQSRQSPRPAATPGDTPDAEAVLQLAQAQQQAEEQLAQTREYCRELIEQARVQAQQVLDQARQQAEDQAQRAAAEAATAQGTDAEEREARLARARSSLAAITAAEDRLREAREQLATEVAQQDPPRE